MSHALTFYTHPFSRARITRWMLEETGLDYDEVILDYGADMKSPEYLAINPMGKVPAIRHGDMVVTENAAVCMYLAELAPEKKLAPAIGSVERGAYYRWLLFLAGPVEALMTAKQGGTLVPGAGYGNEEDVLLTLEQAVQGKTHLAGDQFTTADLYMTAFLEYYMAFGHLPRRPAFEAFVARHAQRPAALAARQRDDALVPAHPHPSMKA
ncbi:glutathione S-transferase family protein [Pseudoxanthomonas dokdonensis]|uniref:Glutathione S-transferase n=1 Tax=Pseudoxanthomonas dokdonensis TaxID=344882 RepID=A0A0R0CSD5_9GAMM|nr:glutathione S-transferase family protein [Pseudoxanthomonas dokdonensis]KRG68967.1 glutathione S-transferase [Pseudoxanthomonas dokdonensis]